MQQGVRSRIWQVSNSAHRRIRGQWELVSSCFTPASDAGGLSWALDDALPRTATSTLALLLLHRCAPVLLPIRPLALRGALCSCSCLT